MVGAVLNNRGRTLLNLTENAADTEIARHGRKAAAVSYRHRRVCNHLSGNCTDAEIIASAKASACDCQVLDNRSVAEPSEKSAAVIGRTVEIPYRISAAVEMSSEAARGIICDSLPVGDVLHVDGPCHSEINIRRLQVL